MFIYQVNNALSEVVSSICAKNAHVLFSSNPGSDK